MIKKLKRKFIILATVAMFLLMSFLICVMNCVNYSAVVSDADTILEFLSQQREHPFNDKKEMQGVKMERRGDFFPRGMSPEIPYESRYFFAIVSDSGEIFETNITQIISVDEDSAKEYVEEAFSSKKNQGFIGQFRYLKSTDDKVTKIMFLDCGRKLDAYFTFLRISIFIGLLGCVIVFLFFLFAAGRIVKPIAESYEKQKRFITDAGHEIKTPLTIISANIDLLEDDFGENESLCDVRQQVKRLTKLTSDLIYLSKMEETEKMIQLVEFPVSDLLVETASEFQMIAQAKKTEFFVKVEPDVSMKGSPDAIRKIVSILLDNAMKYSPEGGIVSLTMKTQKKQMILSVFNTTSHRIEPEQLQQLFERFYRMDASRNSEIGGHGIGLSIAKALTDSHNGQIYASTQKGMDFTMTVTIPL